MRAELFGEKTTLAFRCEVKPKIHLAATRSAFMRSYINDRCLLFHAWLLADVVRKSAAK
jgi:hypothetical protein